MDRRYPERPWIGVGVVVWQGDNVLLVQRGKPPRAGDWSIPGGAQSVGETVVEAARREVQEETGLQIDACRLIDVVDTIQHDADGRVEFHYTLIDYVAECPDGIPIAADDILAAEFVSLDEAKRRLTWHRTIEIIEQSMELR